jgi:hypothetical protein
MFRALFAPPNPGSNQLTQYAQNIPTVACAVPPDDEQIVLETCRCCQWRTQEFCLGSGGSTNSVEDSGQREQGSGGGSPLVRGSAQYANQ